MKSFGLYVVKNEYFTDFPDSGWMDNKGENRPHYYVLEDSDGILWMIPMSSQVESYRAKIHREEAKRGKGNCIYYHIGVVNGKERVFVISDMFPVTDEYILRPYTINKIPYIVKNSQLNAKLYSKAMKFIKLVEQKKMHSKHDIIGIKNKLLNGK